MISCIQYLKVNAQLGHVMIFAAEMVVISPLTITSKLIVKILYIVMSMLCNDNVMLFTISLNLTKQPLT